MKIAVLGLGIMGRQHVRVLTALPGADLIAVCDASLEARAWAEQNVSAPIFETWQDLLMLRPDAVVNALPTQHHFPVTQELLASKVHVLVEKPIATTVDEAHTLIEMAAKQGMTLMVGHTERFNPVVQAMRSEIASGRLGRVISMSARRVGVTRPAVPYVNVAIDLAIHDIDVFAYLLEEQQGRVAFAAGAALDSNVLEDHVELVLKYGNVTAYVQANWITPVKLRRLNVTGTRGFAEVDYLSQTLRVFDAVPELIKGEPWDFFAVSRESDAIDVPVRSHEPLEAELRSFVDCVTSDRRGLTDARHAARALSLAMAATEMMRGNAT